MYSATENRSLNMRRGSTLQPTGCGSPVDRACASDQAATFCQLLHHHRDRFAGGRPDLTDEAGIVTPAHRELHALCGVADGREVISHLHGRLVEADLDEGIDVGAA